MTDEQAIAMQKIHKKILETSKNSNENKEVVTVCSKDFTRKTSPLLGGDSTTDNG